MKIAIILTLVGAVAVAAWLLHRRSRPRIGEIAPASVLQEKHGLYAENRPEITLDPSKVPADLRALIPHAEKWGIGDDIIRNDFIGKSTDAEKQQLHDALYEPYERITVWLDSFGDSAMSDEAAAFMYMQLALADAPSFNTFYPESCSTAVSRFGQAWYTRSTQDKTLFVICFCELHSGQMKPIQ